jgi:hypothetical protein
MMATAAGAQSAAGSTHAQAQNVTPIVKLAACNGTTGGYGCGPGWVRRCWWNHGIRRCACRPC